MVNWNNGLSLNITDKNSAALKKQLFEFYESIIKPPNDDMSQTDNENWDLLQENYVFRLGCIFLQFGWLFLCSHDFRLKRYRRQTFQIQLSKKYVDKPLDWSFAEWECAKLGGRLPNLIYPQLLTPQLPYHIN